MNVRIARHTTDLQSIIKFYHGLLELEILGEFKDHHHYTGVFLGIKGCNWHLEFTVSDEPPNHHADEDDLLVFYIDSQERYRYLTEKLRKYGFEAVAPRNPYWKANASSFKDPDGFRIVLALSIPVS